MHLSAVKDHTSHSIENIGVHFHNWPLHPRSRNPLRELQSILHLYRTIKQCKPDLLHLVTVKSVLYGGLIARLLNIQSVVFAISGRGYLYSSETESINVTKLLANRLYRFALGHRNSIVIVQNEHDLRFFVDHNLSSADRTRLIPGSGVDLNQYKPAEEPVKKNLPVVLFASRMLWDKGVDDFVAAAKLVNQNGIRAQFVLAGTTDPNNPRSVPKDWLEALPDQMGIKWIGHSDNMIELIKDASIVALPSRYGEGVPKILIEAAAMGRAIVTTNWPGCRDVVTHDYNGLLAEPGDTKTLADHIDKLISNPLLCEQYGKNGRAIAERTFSIEYVVDNTLKIYDELSRKV